MWNRDVNKVFVVAEIGQNHQGSLDIAMKMIQTAKECGADCVKFQRSHLTQKFTASALARPYAGVNSWGQTYGEHKAFLEFSINQYRTLQRFANEVGILFTASAMDMTSFQELESELSVPFIKIGSGDADNIPLLRYAASRPIPLVISTGMQYWEHVCSIYELFRHRNDVGLLHCISAYPTPTEDTMLRMIPLYRHHFPEFTVGYSGHELGIQCTVASVGLGARIVERHFTLDKSWKGTDHQASLNPEEFARMVRYIRVLEKKAVPMHPNPVPESVTDSLENVLDTQDYNVDQLQLALRTVAVEERYLLQSEKPCHSKLGKSLVYARSLPAGTVLAEADIQVKVSDPKGLAPRLYDCVVGRILKNHVSLDDPVLDDQF